MNLEDLRYHRTGYFSQGRKSDTLLALFLEHLPGDGELPKRWHYRGQAAFQKRYGELGHMLWAPARSSHLLLMGGHKVLRVWMDTVNSCYVDLNDVLAGELSSQTDMVVESIPAGNTRKCKPFAQRVKVDQQFQVLKVIKAVKRIYGLDTKRL